jgi:hypothetical protein
MVLDLTQVHHFYHAKPCNGAFEISKTSSDYFNFDQLEILCNYFYEDGTRISANSDINVLLKRLKKNN